MTYSNKLLISFILFSILLNSKIQSQSFERIDSLANEACNTIDEISNQNKSVSLDSITHLVFKKHLNDYFDKMKREKIDSILSIFDSRLQKTCESYGKLLYEQLENNGDWVRHSTKPLQKITQEDCNDFYLNKDYFYLEVSGDTVKLQILDGYWIDNFKDSTYSKLKMHINENCEFEIEFEDSNNKTRKNFSKKGDKYKYTIISKSSGAYKLAVEIPEQSIYYTFNMYYKE